MIKGYINEDLEIKFKVCLLSEKFEEVEVILDTGFNGDISLSKNLLELVNLEYAGVKYFELANGQIEKEEVFFR